MSDFKLTLEEPIFKIDWYSPAITKGEEGRRKNAFNAVSHELNEITSEMQKRLGEITSKTYEDYDPSYGGLLDEECSQPTEDDYQILSNDYTRKIILTLEEENRALRKRLQEFVKKE